MIGIICEGIGFGGSDIVMSVVAVNEFREQSGKYLSIVQGSF